MDDELDGLTLLHRLAHDAVVDRFVWSPDGDRLAAPTAKGLRLWNAGDGTFDDRDLESSELVAFSPDGRRIALAGRGWLACHGVDARPGWRCTDEIRRACAIAWSARNDRIAIGDRRGRVVTVDGGTGARPTIDEPHTDQVRCVAWSHDGRQLASASDDATAVIAGADGALVRRLELDAGAMWVTWSPDDRSLAVVTVASVQVFDVATGEHRATLTGHLNMVEGADYSPDGRVLATIAADYTVHLWSIADLRHVGTIRTRRRGSRIHLRHLAFHPSRPVLAILDDRDTTIAIWQLDVERLTRPVRPSVRRLGQAWLRGVAGVAARLIDRGSAPEPEPGASMAAAYEAALAHVRTRIAGRRVSCFVSYAWGDPAHERWVTALVGDLRRADVDVAFDRDDNAAIGSDIARFISREIPRSDFVVVVGTPAYLAKYDEAGSIVAAEIDLIHQRLTGSSARKPSVLPVLRLGERDGAFPPLLRGGVCADFRDDDAYLAQLFELILTLHGIPTPDPAIEALRAPLRVSD